MIGFSRHLAWCGAWALTLTGAAVLVAQGRTDAPDSGSLAALTTEIRQLRLAVEQSARSQTQTQALGVYLSVQQSRVVQAASRLDAIRRDLDGASAHGRQLAIRLANAESGITQTTDLRLRAELEEQVRMLKLEQENATMQEQQARNREAELSQLLQVEDARWTELVSRLEETTRR